MSSLAVPLLARFTVPVADSADRSVCPLVSGAPLPRPLVSGAAVDATDLVAELRRRREAAGWSRAALAARVGLSESTIRNLETGRHLPTAQTLAAIATALPWSASGRGGWREDAAGLLDRGPACLVGMDDGLWTHQLLLAALSGEGGYLAPSLLLSDPACAAAFCAYRNRPALDGRCEVGMWREVARVIRALVGRNPLDILAIACMDGRKETALCEWLQAEGLSRLRVLLVEQSLPLLTSAFRHALGRLGTAPEVQLGGLQAELTQLPLYRLSQTRQRQLFCLLSPQLGLVESEVLVMRQALVNAQQRDLLLLGFDVAMGDPRSVTDRPDEPLLLHADRAEPLLRAFVERPFQLYVRDLRALQIEAVLDVVGCAVPASYAVELQTTVTAPPRKPRRYATWRSKRFQSQTLAAAMLTEGWQLLREWQDDNQTPAAGLHLYERTRPSDPCASDGPGGFGPVPDWTRLPLWTDPPYEPCREVVIPRGRRRLVTLCRAVSQLRCHAVAVRSPESASAVGKRIARLAYLLL